MKIFDRTLSTIERSLDARMLRHNVLASNLANANTPGFRPRDVDVNAAMSQPASLEVNAPERPGFLPVDATAATVTVPVTEMANESPSMDGNGVDLERTLVQLAENGLQYGASAKAAGKKLAILRYVSGDGIS